MQTQSFEVARKKIKLSLNIPKHNVRVAAQNQQAYKVKQVGPGVQDSDQEVLKGSFQDRYQMTGQIGQGAHGVVKTCVSKKNNKTYAVKIMKMGEETTQMIKQNIRVMKCLKHENIINHKVLYLNEHKLTCYLIMEYSPFATLKGLRIQSQQELKFIGQQILKAIAYMHEKEVCHRDLKADNILYSREEKKIKIIDFGICKKMVTRFVKSEMITPTGTLQYKAPQMFSGGGYDQKVDTWAVGIILYELVSGKNPFYSKYEKDLVDNVLTKEVQFNDPCWEGKSNLLKKLITHLLKKDPQSRLSSSQALQNIFFDKKPVAVFNHNASLAYTKVKADKKLADDIHKMTFVQKKNTIAQDEADKKTKEQLAEIPFVDSEDEEAIIDTPVIKGH